MNRTLVALFQKTIASTGVALQSTTGRSIREVDRAACRAPRFDGHGMCDGPAGCPGRRGDTAPEGERSERRRSADALDGTG